MKIPQVLISVFLIYCVWIKDVSGFMSIEDFGKEILPLCYARHDDQNKELPNGQEVPTPNTLESFVSLVEKIEELHSTWKLEDVIKALLSNFRYDDLEYSLDKKSFQSRNAKATTAFDILKEAFNDPAKSAQKFGKDDLTSDEKCALYFMISHTVNDTIREGDEIMTDSANNRQFAKLPREYGVVTLNSNQKHAFALGRVLLGIYAGLKENSMKVNALNIYKTILGKFATELEVLKDLDISLLYTATFGDLIALSMEEAKNEAPITNLFLPNGWWNELDCPLYYNLATENEYTVLLQNVHATYASMRGAIDGYVLGEMIPQVIKNHRDIRLSQVLRGYYSNEGLSYGNNEFQSWCLRQPNFNRLKPDLQTEAVSFGLMYAACSRSTVTSESKDTITTSVRRFFDNRISGIENDLITAVSRDDGTCDNVFSRQCETDNSIFAIMDYKTPENNQILQREIFGNLTTGLQMSRYGSTASIYTNLKPSKGGNELDAIVNFTTHSGCSACAAKYYKPRQILSEPEPSIFRYLNYTLNLFDEEQEDEAGVPAKVVLYFNFGTPSEDWSLRDAVWTVRKHHREARIVAIGPRKESLKPFVRNEERDIISTTFSNADFHKNLKARVCKIPAIFQYTNCHSRTDSDELNNKYQGFITPGHIQYWAMYPKHFLKSYSIKLSFQALSGQLKVCFSRHYKEIFEQKDPKSSLCQDTSSATDNTVHFYEKNPCHRYSEDECRPFYFYVEAKTTASSQTNDMICTDARCKTPDQIQFEFVHQGISCNKGFRLFCSYSVLFYTISASLFWLLSLTRC